MALLSSTALAYAIPFTLIYYALSRYFAHRRLLRFAKAHNATFPKHIPSRLPFGIQYVWRTITTARRGGDILDDIVEKSYAANGATFTQPGFFGPREVYTVDPLNIQALLATKFQDFDLGERRIAQFSPLLGRSIFTADGPFWEHSRALFRPQFSRENINDLAKTEDAVKALFAALPMVGKPGDGSVTVDIMPLLFRFTLDTATGFLFGESVDSQTAAATGRVASTSAAAAMAADLQRTGGKEDMTFAEAFHEAQMWITMRVRLQGLYWLAPSGTGKRAAGYMRRYVDHYVKLALSAAKPSREKYSLLDTLAEATRDENELRDQILGILLAGRDTTATLLSWVLLLLAQHPAVFEKLRGEILKEFGEYSEDAEGIDFGALKGAQYLQFVLRETLRVYNAVPLNLRIAARDTVLPRGGGPDGMQPVVVRKGQTVNFSPYVLHRRADVWAEPLAFRPERWEGTRLDWNYVPFSGGPRICLGQQFALTEAGFLIVRLLQRFKAMEWVGPVGKPRKDIHFTMAPKDGVPVRLVYAD
ncbi:Cytochrome P450 52A5 [Colletotrichum gloeosporioides]|uniref:Cytochrome P450 52A5 n=1 Tax=Colletotrichum gloeosporioides TaxID=474922 RepID=A0A8H4CC27_COLGL|nr:Cytochrome P450 52A5 [Colletotrichum gloeosporioides]KAF3801268.1 Cytochrome P450 52A5 [Colletotrichum gloeosporioides]